MTDKLYNVDAVRTRAKRRLPKMVFDFLEGGALDEHTLRRNREAFDTRSLKQRVLVDLSEVSTSTSVLGTNLAVPVIVSPMGLLTVLHPGADTAVARAAAAAGSVVVHSPWSGCSLEETHANAHGRMWAQIAFWENRAVSDEHIARARNLGIDTLVVAGDVAISSKRERDLRHGGQLPPKPPLADVVNVALHPRWAARWLTGPRMTWGTYRIDGRPIRLREMDPWMTQHGTLRATWEDIRELRSRWDGQLVVKGIMCSEDAQLAVDAGADAVFVSNHGGRQFDMQPASLDVLPDVAETVAGRAQVIFDGGIRRGSDIAVALSLGADLVSAGRPFAYGLAAAGAEGVGRVFEILREELETVMGFVGATSLRGLGPQRLANRDGRPVMAAAELTHGSL